MSRPFLPVVGRFAMQWLFAMLLVASTSGSVFCLEPEVCPSTLTGKYSAGAYLFEYQSWVEKAGDQFVYSYCIRNTHAARDTYFAWTGSGLSGFVKAGATAYSRLPFATDDTDDAPQPFYFGALPTKIEVGTKMHRPTTRRSSIDDFRPMVQFAQFARPDTGKSDELISYAQIFFPTPEMVGRLRNKTRQKIIKEIEQTPNALYVVRMKFTSRIEPSTDGTKRVTHTCEWASNVRPAESPLLYAKFRDPRLHQTLLGTKPASEELWMWIPGDDNISGAQTVNANAVISETSTRMSIVTPDGSVIATIPISFWRDEPPP